MRMIKIIIVVEKIHLHFLLLLILLLLLLLLLISPESAVAEEGGDVVVQEIVMIKGAAGEALPRADEAEAVIEVGEAAGAEEG